MSDNLPGWLRTACHCQCPNCDAKRLSAADEIERLRARPTHPPNGAIDFPKMVGSLEAKNRALREKLEKALKALRAIDVCESQFAIDNLKRAEYAIEYCQTTARQALREIEE